MKTPTIRVGIDVGYQSHRVAVTDNNGARTEEFDISHDSLGFTKLISYIEAHKPDPTTPVSVAMEGYNGYARPLDTLLVDRGYTLYNVNNLKLARYKEVFAAPAKTDSIDTNKILELFHLQESLPLSEGTLQEVELIPPTNSKLKRLTRRRRQLVNDKVRVLNRFSTDLQAVCPELSRITKNHNNLWFLRFITSREELTKLARVKKPTLLKIGGIGTKYARVIRNWQQGASFSDEVGYVGPMIISDAKKVLKLLAEIASLDGIIADLATGSKLAKRIGSIPGYGKTTRAELAGEIGTTDRFDAEGGLGLYLGMCPLANSSGQYKGTKNTLQVNQRAKQAMMNGLFHHIAEVPQSRKYYDKKRAEGKSHNQALRSLGRHMVRVIWSMVREDRDYEMREQLS